MTVSATDVADFFKQNPDFLLHNPGVLAFVHLPTQESGNVSSLQDKQIQTMREKVKGLEHKIADLSHAAIENQAIIEKLLTLQRELLRIKEASEIPQVVVNQLGKLFSVPMVKLRLWEDGALSDSSVFAADLEPAAKEQLDAMLEPYCGFSDFAPAFEMFEGEEVKPRSVVVIALKVGVSPKSFGCLALGSPDKDRFTPDLEKDFLVSLSETACAALSRLI